MKVSSAQEENVFERKVYLGVENFKVVAVNPTADEFKEMNITVSEEPQYVSTAKRDFGDGEQEYDVVNIRIFLDNENPNNPIKTQVSYNIYKSHHLSSTGKYLVLNKYGTSTWLEEEAIESGNMPSNMSWFVAEDVKKAYAGEPNLVDFVKAFYNLPNINQNSNAKTKESGVAVFSEADFEKMFKGDFSAIRKTLLVDGAGQTVGFLLGAKEYEGEYRQNLFGRMPLKSYVKKTDKTKVLVDRVNDAQENGAYADVIFDLSDTRLKEFNAEVHGVSASENVADMGGEDDDLPF